jgi:hypothetical protein
VSLKSKVVIGVAAALLVAGIGAVLLYGLIPTSGDAHPPCDQLPTVAEATSGLAGNPGLADEIEGVGDGVAVEVGKPCSEGEDRALVKVTYESDSERDAIRDLLMRGDGFGVPVYLEER